MAKSFRYVDLTALNEFLTKLKAAYAANSTSAFQVNIADKAVKDESGNNIANTYLTKTSAGETYVPLTRTIAGVDLNDDITKAELLTALNVADGAQVNVLEGITVDGVAQTITSKVAALDLSAYAKKTDITAVMEFKGVVDYTSELPAASSSNTGDVYIVRYKGTSGTEALNAEYVSTGTAWEEFGNALALENYYTKGQTDSQISSAVSTASAALQGNIDAIYKAASGDDPESGVLVTKIGAVNTAISNEVTRATGVEGGLQSAIDTLNGADTVSGSVANKIKTAIEGLDVTAVSGDYITAVGEVDGKVTVTTGTKGAVASGDTALVDGGTVYTAIEAAKGDISVTIRHGEKSPGVFEYRVGPTGNFTEVDTHAVDAILVDGVKVTNNVAEGGAHTTTTLTPDANKDVTIDLTAYALEADLEAVSTSEIDALFS